ncbi:uncharacterized protein LOC122521627 [Polistes fuscatus]|uniref:uncharacterized protein LOC122521627 n=1 Tax=Polistes fuscatus TaxID=30207 RepID=UPI001CA9993F|nr:uncharacterized protein LOC122521627 [Polistes fuscatus]
MSSKRKISIEYSDDIATSSSDNGSDIVPLVRKTTKQLMISDESDNEDYYQPPELWVWKNNENQPKIWQYMEIPGIKEDTLDQLSTSKKEVGVFNIMFISIFWENLVTETNLYGKQKSLVQMYWSKRSVIETPIFRQTMPYRRFLQISRFLHFANNNLVNRRRLSYKQYNPSNKARFGIKVYKLCESSSGYCYNFKIYTGCDKIHTTENASETVVKELSTPILHKGHTLYLDNWYSSTNLFVTLLNSKTNVIGTGYAEYKIKIAELLLENTPLPNYNRNGQLSSEDLPLRLQAQQ